MILETNFWATFVYMLNIWGREFNVSEVQQIYEIKHSKDDIGNWNSDILIIETTVLLILANSNLKMS